ncbi:MAG TPA: rhomboid family intramembrane serine protease [Intrasporangiaceae bacterium]|nr:rhomboid family intramembrane serine protease [Intrasporangiaceae bacterium]
MTEPFSPQPPTAPPVCPRHPDQISYVRCQRCSRPTCPTCQRQAAVGVQCVDCVAEGRKTVRQGRTVFGGTVTDGRPTLTFGIIGVTVAFFVLQMAMPPGKVSYLLGFSPVVGDVEPWRFFTAALVHSANFMHIGFNMYALYILGQFLEPALGRARFMALYLLGALGGSVMILLLATPDSRSWNTLTVGASGAVFALFGTLFVVQRRLGGSNRGLLILLGINAAIPFIVPNISWQGHLGGFLTGLAAGAVLAFLVKKPEIGKAADFSRHWWGLGAIAVVLVVLAVAKYAIV